MPDQPPIDPASKMEHLGSQISTDRPCASCSFNLFGQQIMREPHYELVVVRCPECGAIASLQEYPAMTRWIGKWKLLLAAIWIILLVGLLAATTASMFGTSMGVLNIASYDYASMIYADYSSWVEETTGETNGVGFWKFSDEWIDSRYPSFVASHTPAWSYIDREARWVWLTLSLLAFIWGSLWTTIMLGARRRSVILALTPIVFLIGFLVFAASGNGFNSSQMLASRQLFISVQAISSLVILISLGLGVWLGRKFARMLICLMLPPRLRTPLAILWTRDGLDLPKPRSY